jgi:ribonuclease D
MLIQDQQEFARHIELVREARVCTIDTEFVWRKTYAPRIGLIQIAARPDLTFAIDPLAIKDPEPLADLLTDASCLKVFHACSQDLEVLYQYCGALPEPLFDTQIASAMLDMGYQIGYADLVKQCLDLVISKTQQFTDWCQRPLTPQQLEYAVKEVSLLLECYEHLERKLGEAGRLDWTLEDCRGLITAYQEQSTNPPPTYKRIRGSGRFNEDQLGVLKCLAQWREQQAAHVDCPPRWIVDDKSLLEIARSQPQNSDELLALDGVDNKLCTRWAAKFIECVEDGPHQSVEPLPRRSAGSARLEKKLVRSALDRIGEIASTQGIASEVMATKVAVTALVRAPDSESKLLTGWRGRLLADELAAILPGPNGQDRE